MSRRAKIEYVYNNSFLSREYLEKIDRYELNIIYKNVMTGVVYGITMEREQ